MCKWVSGEAVFVDESEVRVYTLPHDDSHNNIRAKHNIAEDAGPGLAQRHCPVELFPEGDFADVDGYTFAVDGPAPEWWTDAHTASATRQLAFLARSRMADIAKTGIYKDYIDASAATTFSAPKLTSVAGYIDASAATTIDCPAIR